MPLEAVLSPAAFPGAAVLVLLVVALAFSTLLGSFVIAYNYPSVLKADEIQKDFEAAAETCKVKTAIDVLEIIFPEQNVTDGDAAGTEMTLLGSAKALPVTQKPGQKRQRSSITINPLLTPKNRGEIINRLRLVLEVAFVLAVAVISFASSTLRGRGRDRGRLSPPSPRRARRLGALR